MEALILSDLHGRRDALSRVWERCRPIPDAVFFLGDGLRGICREDVLPATLYAVRGNCDWGVNGEAPEELMLSFEGHRLLLLHGHRQGVKGGTAPLAAYAAARGADVVLYGHTHLPREEVYPSGTVLGGATLASPLYLFNPGSLADGSFGRVLLRGRDVLFSTGTL